MRRFKAKTARDQRDRVWPSASARARRCPSETNEFRSPSRAWASAAASESAELSRSSRWRTASHQSRHDAWADKSSSSATRAVAQGQRGSKSGSAVDARRETPRSGSWSIVWGAAELERTRYSASPDAASTACERDINGRVSSCSTEPGGMGRETKIFGSPVGAGGKRFGSWLRLVLRDGTWNLPVGEFPSVDSVSVIAARVSGVAMSRLAGRCQLASINCQRASRPRRPQGTAVPGTPFPGCRDAEAEQDGHQRQKQPHGCRRIPLHRSCAALKGVRELGRFLRRLRTSALSLVRMIGVSGAMDRIRLSGNRPSVTAFQLWLQICAETAENMKRAEFTD